MRQDGGGEGTFGPRCRPGYPGLTAEHGARSPGPVPAARHAGYHRGDKKYVPRNLLFPLRAFCVSRKPAV